MEVAAGVDGSASVESVIVTAWHSEYSGVESVWVYETVCGGVGYEMRRSPFSLRFGEADRRSVMSKAVRPLN